MSKPVALLRSVCKIHAVGDTRVTALNNVTLEIPTGCFTVISGPSGSGKTSLLSIVGCIDRPSSGTFFVRGIEASSLGDDALSDFRARNVGFIFQNFNLLPMLTCAENIEFPLLITKACPAQRRRRVADLLDAVELTERAHHYPSQMSGGQRQRVAIARALAGRPGLVLADEPTANLDAGTGSVIIDLMREMQRREGTSFIFSSHDPQVLAQADHIVQIRDGRLASEAAA